MNLTTETKLKTLTAEKLGYAGDIGFDRLIQYRLGIIPDAEWKSTRMSDWSLSVLSKDSSFIAMARACFFSIYTRVSLKTARKHLVVRQPS